MDHGSATINDCPRPPSTAHQSHVVPLDCSTATVVWLSSLLPSKSTKRDSDLEEERKGRERERERGREEIAEGRECLRKGKTEMGLGVSDG